MTMTQAETDLEPPTSVIADYLRKTISVSYLLGLAWSGRIIVAACATLGLLYGIYTVYSAGPSYEASIRVSPAASDSSLGDIGGGGGLLASLTGGGTTQVPKFIQFTYGLYSVEVARGLVRKYDLLCSIYRSECDLKTHQWTRHPRDIREWIASITAQLSGLPDPNTGPRSAVDLAKYITNNLAVDQVKKTDSVYTLSIIHSNPKFATLLLSRVVEASNDYVRAQSRETQKRYVEYLTASAAKATNVEQRQAIDNLLLQEERQLMMTEVDVPYAAQILDGPTVTPIDHALKTIALYIALGFALGVAIATSRDLLPLKWRIW